MLGTDLDADGKYTIADTVADSEYVPEFVRAENGQFYLSFTARELWSPNSLEKEILRCSAESPDNS